MICDIFWFFYIVFKFCHIVEFFILKAITGFKPVTKLTVIVKYDKIRF